MKKILVVDDDPGLVDILKVRLIVNNYEVFSAADGEEGVKEALAIKPDLILMDIMMPKMLGGDAVRQLKANKKTKHIPIVFLTAVAANSPEGSENQGINVDGQYFPTIAKPFKTEHLLSVIKNLLEEKVKN